MLVRAFSLGVGSYVETCFCSLYLFRVFTRYFFVYVFGLCWSIGGLLVVLGYGGFLGFDYVFLMSLSGRFVGGLYRDQVAVRWPTARYGAVYLVIGLLQVGLMRVVRFYLFRGLYVGEDGAICARSMVSVGIYRVGYVVSIGGEGTFVFVFSSCFVVWRFSSQRRLQGCLLRMVCEPFFRYLYGSYVVYMYAYLEGGFSHLVRIWSSLCGGASRFQGCRYQIDVVSLSRYVVDGVVGITSLYYAFVGGRLYSYACRRMLLVSSGRSSVLVAIV